MKKVKDSLNLWKNSYIQKKTIRKSTRPTKERKSKFDHYLDHLADQFHDFLFFDVSTENSSIIC